MKLLLRGSFAALGLATLAASASAQTYTDDFNRPDSSSMGPAWSEDNGDFEIQSGQAVGVGFPWDDLSILRHTAYSGTFDSTVVSMDVSTQGKPSSAAGVCIGHQFWGGVATKIQDNDGDGLFDRVFFEAAINAGSWHSSPVPIHFDLTTPMAQCRIVVQAIDTDTAMVQVYDMLGALKDTGTASGISTSAFPPVGTEAVIYTQYAGAAIDNVEIRAKSLFGFPSELSMATGGTQSLAINFGPSHAGELYLLLGSTSGTTPATPAGPGIDLPLVADSYLIYTLQNPNRPPLTGSFGSLSAAGTASATFTLPTAFDPGLVGVTLHHAAVAFDLTSGLTVTGATEAVAVTFNP